LATQHLRDEIKRLGFDLEIHEDKLNDKRRMVKEKEDEIAEVPRKARKSVLDASLGAVRTLETSWDD
jgi:hypothetical protein